MRRADGPPRVALAGSVGFSRVALEALFRNGLPVVGVLGLNEARSANVSDYARLDDLAARRGVEYLGFDNINDPAIVEAVRNWKPDLLFVAGLSQLLRGELMSVPRLGCVGFHPTPLPYGRGRAPIVWLTYDGTPGAVSFFLIDEGVDSGPIFVQEPFAVGAESTAADVIESACAAIARALDRWLPRLREGEFDPVPQDESEASYFGRRSPEDGLIDWHQSADSIHRLVRAAGRPYPGAYTYAGGARLIVWRSALEHELRFRGVVGRILKIGDGSSLLVQTGDGLLWLQETEIVSSEATPRIAVGARLGYSPGDEIHSLRRRVTELERLLRSRTQ